MAELRVTPTEVILKKPLSLINNTEPYWKLPVFEKVVEVFGFRNQHKTYTIIFIKRESVNAFEITEETHTIRISIAGSPTQEIQFEDETAYNAAVNQLHGFFTEY